MKKVYSFIVLSITMLLSNNCISQSNNFIAGYYVDQMEDTIKGYVSVKTSNIPTTFMFKEQLQDKNVTIISLDSCKSLSFGDKFFLNWFGKRSMIYIDKSDFSIKNIDSSITGTIPLTKLYNGTRLSLYYYYDIRDHFFVQGGNTIQELLITYKYITDWEKKFYYTKTPIYFINNVFRDQIIAPMNNQLTKKQMNIIRNTLYERWSLIRLFKALN